MDNEKPYNGVSYMIIISYGFITPIKLSGISTLYNQYNLPNMMPNFGWLFHIFYHTTPSKQGGIVDLFYHSSH